MRFISYFFASLCVVLGQSASSASPAFAVTSEYSFPKNTSHAVYFTALSDSARAYALVNDQNDERSLIQFSGQGVVEWKQDIGRGGTRPSFAALGGTPDGLFFGAYRRPSLIPGEVSIDGATFSRDAGLQVTSPLQDQLILYIRAASDDGAWLGGDVTFQDLSTDFVVFTPERTPIFTGPFLSLDFARNGKAVGVDASTGRAAVWSQHSGIELLPEPPIDVTETAAVHVAQSGLIHVIASHSFGSAQRLTQMLYDGKKYRVLENTPTGETNVRAINSDGWVVGSDSSDPAHTRAIVWIDDKLYDLNALVSGLNDVTLTDAQSINDSGQITVLGYNSVNEPVAYLLSTIIPEPLSVSVLCFLALAACRNRSGPAHAGA